MVKQQCGYLNVCVYYSTSMENNYFYFWAKKGPPDLFSTLQGVQIATFSLYRYGIYYYTRNTCRLLIYHGIFLSSLFHQVFRTGTCSTVHVRIVVHVCTIVHIHTTCTCNVIVPYRQMHC